MEDDFFFFLPISIIISISTILIITIIIIIIIVVIIIIIMVASCKSLLSGACALLAYDCHTILKKTPLLHKNRYGNFCVYIREPRLRSLVCFG